jgi:hypothetical protein
MEEFVLGATQGHLFMQLEVTQLKSIALALLIFPLYIWVPGATFLYATDLFEFRKRTVPVQLALGLMVSISCIPILVYYLIRWADYTGIWIFFALIWIVSAVYILLNLKAFLGAVGTLFKSHRSVVVFVLLCCCAALFLEVDWVSSRGVRPNLTSMDQTAHVAVTDAIERSGIPPVNPFVYPGHPVHLLYYYGWYAICSVVAKAGGAALTARSAVQAGKVYVGLGVVALIVVFLDFFARRLFPGIRKVSTTIGIALLTITGLDLLPWTFVVLYRRTGRGPGPMLSLEWWNEQVTAWLGAILMSPHHVAGLIMCMTGLVMVFGILKSERKFETILILVAALAFASAAITSFYVTFVFAFGLLLWMIWAAIEGWRSDVYRICVVGIIAAILYLPVALELHAASTVGFPLGFTIRAFEPVDYWLPSIVKSLKGSHLLYVLRFIFLPVNYFLELGFFAVAAVLFWKWRRSLGTPLAKEESLLTSLAIGSVLICTFLRSTVRWNDLGWRGFLVAQFVLLLWGIPVVQAVLDRRGQDPSTAIMSRWRLLTISCLVIGLAGTAVEMFNFRANFAGPETPLTIEMTETYEWISQHTPYSTIIVFDPDEDSDYFGTLYGHRQMAVDGHIFGFLYGGIAQQDTNVLADATDLFSKDTSVEDVRKFRDQYHVNAVVVFSTDPVWSDPSSWVWKMQPAFQTDKSKVFLLSQAEGPSAP